MIRHRFSTLKPPRLPKRVSSHDVEDGELYPGGRGDARGVGGESSDEEEDDGGAQALDFQEEEQEGSLHSSQEGEEVYGTPPQTVSLLDAALLASPGPHRFGVGNLGRDGSVWDGTRDPAPMARTRMTLGQAKAVPGAESTDSNLGASREVWLAATSHESSEDSRSSGGSPQDGNVKNAYKRIPAVNSLSNPCCSPLSNPLGRKDGWMER